jgi:hypothetical protein
LIRTACLIVAALSLCLCNCAVPLAPGYRVSNETRQVHFVAAGPTIQIRENYTLVNSGTSELNFIDLTLPAISSYGRTDLRAELDGHTTEFRKLAADLQSESPDEMQIAFTSPWKEREKHDLTIEYAFESPADSASKITLEGDDFHLGPRGAFVVLEPPKGLLAPSPTRPAKMDYTVEVPADFRILARGKLAGKKKAGSEIEYRYRLNAMDLPPFVVAGHYVESTPLGTNGAIFWTFEAANIDPAGARAITAAWNTLQKDFGTLGPNARTPHIVEVQNLREHISGGQTFAVVAFPGGALVNPSALAQGTGSDAFVEAVSHALAHNWFGEDVYPAADADLVLGEGLPEYAMLAIDEARGGQAARRRRIQRYLAAYEDAARQSPELTLAASRLSDPPAERRIALAKAPLFFAALEDECGSQAMQSALRQILTLLRGQEVGYPVLRSALEQASGKNLAATFRLWLDEKGIPGEFRARYGGGGGG